MIDKNYILKNKIQKLKKITGIYFLLEKDEVVYVGQTVNGLSRVYSHSDKKWDSYCFVPVDKDDLNRIETENIVFYKPKYNKSMNSEFLSFDMIRNRLKTLGVEKPKFYKNNIKKIISEKNIKIYNLSKNESISSYINKNDFDLIYKEVKNV